MLYGRNIDINEILQFLTNNQYDEQRILNIYGTHGNGRSNITRYAIKYVMRRHYFEGGAFFVEC
jgi:type II secretory pathway predicted ATPase ExeA